MKGLPAGQSVNDSMRLLSAYGRMIALANSGLWQATEYATMMGQYGLLKTIKSTHYGRNAGVQEPDGNCCER